MNNFDFDLKASSLASRANSIRNEQMKGFHFCTETSYQKEHDMKVQQSQSNKADAEKIADSLTNALAMRPFTVDPLIDRIESDQLDELRSDYRKAISDGDKDEAKRIASKGLKVKDILLRAASQRLVTIPTHVASHNLKGNIMSLLNSIPQSFDAPVELEKYFADCERWPERVNAMSFEKPTVVALRVNYSHRRAR